MIGDAELVRRFTRVGLMSGAQTVRGVYDVFNDMLHAARVIDQMAPDSREKSLAITALEEASMWTMKAVTTGANEVSA